MQIVSGTTNRHVDFGLLIGLIIIYGMYLEFQITDGWIQSLYRCMNLFRRIVATSRPADQYGRKYENCLCMTLLTE